MGIDLHCTCYPAERDGHAFVRWIALVFQQCYYTPIEVTSFVLGLLNIGCWLVAQVPQVIKTFIIRDGGAISAGFMLLWLTGDITNLLGCIFTHQLPTQLYTAIYYCAMDVIMLSQMFGFAACRKHRWCGLEPLKPASTAPNSERDTSINDDAQDRGKLEPDEQQRLGIGESDPQENEKSMGFIYVSVVTLAGMALSFIGFAGLRSVVGASSHTEQDIAQGGFGGALRAAAHELLSVGDLSSSSSSSSKLPNCEVDLELTQTERVIGDVSAWVCFVCYFFGRVPQMVLNYKRKATEGLSMTMFLFALLGNLFYGTSIVIMPIDTHSSFFWESTLPYILGSYGCVLPSLIVLWQFYHYSKRKIESPPLLEKRPEV